MVRLNWAVCVDGARCIYYVRILDFPDLTVDGSFTTGGDCGDSDYQRCESMARYAGRIAGGMFAGICTGWRTKGKINGLLSGIIMMIALYSINMRIMGKPNISLSQEKLSSELLIRSILCW